MFLFIISADEIYTFIGTTSEYIRENALEPAYNAYNLNIIGLLLHQAEGVQIPLTILHLLYNTGL